jgi:hypothetical protein
MAGKLRRVLIVGVLALTLAGLGAGVALADDSGGEQIVDVSKQLENMTKKMADLQAHGRFARQGKLAAAADCGFADPAAIFAPWGDTAGYSLIPGGDLADPAGWTLKNVTVSDEHDPFTPGSGSLLFAKGDSEAATPAMCVNLDNPTLRVFLADRGGNGKAHLEVKVLYEDVDGHTHNLTIARLKVDAAWQPSVVIPIGVNMLSAAAENGWTPVAFDFKVHGLQKGETFVLDGIYVDPCWSR